MSEMVTMQKMYHALLEIKQRMISKDELVSLMKTLEILHNPKTMKQLRASEADIRAGRTRPVKNFKDVY